MGDVFGRALDKIHEGATQRDDDGETQHEETEITQTPLEYFPCDHKPARVFGEAE